MATGEFSKKIFQETLTITENYPIIENYWIISHFLKIPLKEIYLRGLKGIKEKEIKIVKEAINLRKRGYPLSYIIGEVEFCGLNFNVEEGVFTPRKDSEILVEISRKFLQNTKKRRILDLGCGVGNLSLSIAYFEEVNIVGIDILPLSIKLSSRNAKNLNLEKRAEFIKGDMFQYLRETKDRFSLIISNPPYVPSEEKEFLPPEVTYEPEISWNGGKEGMEFYPEIISEGIEKIFPSGYIILEVGEGQAKEVRCLMEKAGLKETGIELDKGKRKRLVWGRKK